VIEMADKIQGATALIEDITGFEEEFALDVRVVEGSDPHSNMLQSTSNGCGSSCAGSACTSRAGYPA
jgi:FxLD family lantipeptide